MSRYLIVGGVAGGATAAARLRRNDEKADIVLFERGDYISYANCGLPYYISGVIPDRDDLFVQTPEGFKARFNVDVRLKSDIIKINRAVKTIEVKKTGSGEVYSEKYDKLVVSPGAEPVIPPIPGIDGEGIFTLRSIQDTDSIKDFIDTKKPERAVIVGAGFIGLEMAETLEKRGVLVTIVEMSDQVMNILDFEMASMIHHHLKTKKVELFLKEGVKAFKNPGENRLSVVLGGGKELFADMAIISIGVKPEIKLARESGLKTGELGGIEVNEYLQTSDLDIYAVGDAIEVTNPVIGKKVLMPLAGPANKQGRIAADNIVYGNNSKYIGSIGTAIVKVFDLAVASAGASEKLLRRENIPYMASITHSSSHALYYPNAAPMSIKILFSPDDGKILGAQIVGYRGVDKRIDVIAAFLLNGKTVYDLEMMEQSYAPPYSSAKDPVNIAGFTADNILKGKVKIVQWYDIMSRDPSKTILVDVRTEEEYRKGTIEDAVNIPVDEIRGRLPELPKDKKIIVFCGVGLRAYTAARILTQSGFDSVFNLSGGYKTYEFTAVNQANSDIYQGDPADIT